jgi:hypothetical protein
MSFIFSLNASDVLTLTNGMKFEGKVTRIKECSIVFKTEIGSFIIPGRDIENVQFENLSSRRIARYQSHFNPDNCLAGKMDASIYHGKKGGHFFLGFLFGPFAVLGTLLANPTPDKGNATYRMSDNRELFHDPYYLRCYKRKARGGLVAMELAGWASWLVVFALIYAISV